MGGWVGLKARARGGGCTWGVRVCVGPLTRFVMATPVRDLQYEDVHPLALVAHRRSAHLIVLLHRGFLLSASHGPPAQHGDSLDLVNII